MSVRVLVLADVPNLPRQTIAMSPGLALQLGAITNLTHELKFGAATVSADLTTQSSLPAHAIAVGRGLSAALHLPHGVHLALSHPSHGHLQFGPVVGLFTTHSKHPPWGEQTDLLALTVRHGNRMGQYVYVFTPDDVDLDQAVVNGWRVTAAGQWVRRPCPLPDVIYDRIPSRKHERLPAVVDLKAKLRPTYGQRYFNPGYLDKWQLHEPLLANPAIARFLPETILYSGPADLSAMLARHRIVFLKPIDGSLGRGVVRLNRMPGGKVSYRLPTGQTAHVCSSAGEAARRLSRLTSVRQYLVQQGVHLATLNGSPFDVRVLAQKGQGGRWFRTKVYARVAQPGSYLSNLARGATAWVWPGVLHISFGAEAGKRRVALAAVRELGRRVPPAVEAAAGEAFGELGIDIGIDTTGRCWLIEVNSKPMRTFDSSAGSRTAVRNSIVRPLLYARYLTDAAPLGIAVKRRRRNE